MLPYKCSNKQGICFKKLNPIFKGNLLFTDLLNYAFHFRVYNGMLEECCNKP